jgi:cell division GTPase FtsZ
MLQVGVIGIGNAGSQVAALAKEKLGVEVLAINSSEKDLQTIPESVPHLLIGDSKGAGKERGAAKKFLKAGIMNIINNDDYASIFNQEVLFIVSSTGGGTGSGTSILLSNIISEVYPNTKIIIVGILPTIKEALSTQLNSLSYMEELYKSMDEATYMLYDNDKLAKIPSHQMMQQINESIVNDIDVIRGTYQLPTKYSSIDEKDMFNIITTTGRIAIASLRDIKEKDLDETTIEDLIVKEFKTNAHCELQRDKIVYRTGVISNLSDRLNEQFDTHIPVVQEFIGSPVEEFEHIVINDDRHLPNNIFLIASGLTQVNDRIRKINDRIEEIEEAQKQKEEDSELGSVDFASMSRGIARKKVDENSSENVDLKSIFSKFDV